MLKFFALGAFALIVTAALAPQSANAAEKYTVIFTNMSKHCVLFSLNNEYGQLVATKSVENRVVYRATGQARAGTMRVHARPYHDQCNASKGYSVDRWDFIPGFGTTNLSMHWIKDDTFYLMIEH